ncbi:hypothetical protein N476_25150 [Pseudoalteromonas luteoviolacea H33]|uniref:Uncharacterized protein n=1 Tax=Pseudoalteromonas luteoviolacea H33 TaxID=1365251 RepID=A0A167ARK9_9GAMM|nr:hypothetical protein N476_25150 [Pseudoalteromonas luteoviolacea H33]KZN73973.1 hypothetical protein N477_22525 [Pseudoalteromonas luteoviolacea H33-S]
MMPLLLRENLCFYPDSDDLKFVTITIENKNEKKYSFQIKYIGCITYKH